MIFYDGRTLPGVRGLKSGVGNYNAIGYSRTLPGVRGLKLSLSVEGGWKHGVAPYPGCVD